MKMKVGDVLNYKNSDQSVRYGTGVVTLITSDEYTILWSGKGVTRYRRSILDSKSEQVFQHADKGGELPKERHLHLGNPKVALPFNENYDREKLKTLCEKLNSSGARTAKSVAEGLAAELFTRKLVLRGAAKAVLLQLAELCNSRGSAGYDEAQDISRELFFGYVLRKSDFAEVAEGSK